MPARRKSDPGQLKIKREWYGPEYRTPAKHQLHLAGDLVDQVLKTFGLEEASQLADIQNAWSDIAGKDNARQSRPGKLERGILTIHVDHHLWLNELKQVAAPALLKRLQQRFGKARVRQLRFEITPEEEV